MKSNHFLRAAVAAAALAAALPAVAAEPLQYEPAQSTLTGRLYWQPFSGGPGFGETPATDEKLRAPMLHLDAPIDIAASTDAPEDSFNRTATTGLQDVQLVWPEGKAFGDGACVTLTGGLFRRGSPQHVSDALLSVETITLSDACTSPAPEPDLAPALRPSGDGAVKRPSPSPELR